MGEYLDLTLRRVPAGFTLPAPLVSLFAWVEREGVVATGYDGDLYGSLSAEARGTDVELRGFGPEETDGYLAAWFDGAPSVPRIWPFCRTGADGSYAALWDDDGRMRVVHLGSGSGSMLTCVLADDPVDFLRLLAIGYEELCWHGAWSEPPDPGTAMADDWRPVHAPFRDWVTETFGVTIPATAAEIVVEPSEMGDGDTTDDFCRLVNGLIDL